MKPIISKYLNTSKYFKPFINDEATGKTELRFYITMNARLCKFKQNVSIL